jgi:hypothetical protein
MIMVSIVSSQPHISLNSTLSVLVISLAPWDDLGMTYSSLSSSDPHRRLTRDSSSLYSYKSASIPRRALDTISHDRQSMSHPAMCSHFHRRYRSLIVVSQLQFSPSTPDDTPSDRHSPRGTPMSLITRSFTPRSTPLMLVDARPLVLLSYSFLASSSPNMVPRPQQLYALVLVPLVDS